MPVVPVLSFLDLDNPRYNSTKKERMSLVAILKFNEIAKDSNGKDEEFDVITCRYHFSRHYNYFMPDTDALCDKVELTVRASEYYAFKLYDWYISQSSLKGSIEFKYTEIDESNATTKTLSFEDAKCFSLSEIYDISNKRLLKLEFMASKITVGGVEFKHK